ncbi:MAG: restriction endonuclease subunit S [Balneola sp.]
MKSNYKRIGDFIELVDERNTDLKVDTLVGLSINKIFIPSVANTVGTNMKRYKIIRKNQFACSTMQVRRDKKMPVALLKEHDKAIISQAYPVFQVIDENVLLSEYLMMWMSREEFDRHACFLAVGGVRGSLEWEDFLDMEIPVPSIEKQREIVTEYNAVVNRIKLNEELNQKLEETAQTIYRQWFEKFEFPIPKELAEEMGTPELEGKPYKSSGGEMVYNEELEKEIPMGWGVNSWKEISVLEYGKRLTGYRECLQGVPVYGTNGQVGYTKKPLFNDEGIIIGRKGVYRGVHFSLEPFYVIDTAYYLRLNNISSMIWAFYEILSFDMNEMESGSAIPSTSRDDFYQLKSTIPLKNIMNDFDTRVRIIFDLMRILEGEDSSLSQLTSIMRSKMTKVEVSRETEMA